MPQLGARKGDAVSELETPVGQLLKSTTPDGVNTVLHEHKDEKTLTMAARELDIMAEAGESAKDIAGLAGGLIMAAYLLGYMRED